MLRGLVLFLCLANAFARSIDCPFSSVSVRGHVIGPITRDDVVVVELRVTGHEKPDRQTLNLESQDFSTNVRYWTISRQGHELKLNQGILPVGEHCNAKPESLKVSFMHGDETVDTVQLKSENLLNQFGVIRVKNPVVLQSK